MRLWTKDRIYIMVSSINIGSVKDSSKVDTNSVIISLFVVRGK